MDTNDIFGAFPGRELDFDACEALLYTRWPEKERKREPALFASKWWDCRVLHPVHASYLFAHMYAEQVRSIIRAHLNDAPAVETAAGTVRDWQPIKSGDVFEPPNGPEKRVVYWQRKILGLIRARQAADEDGIPYDHFIREGLKHFYFGAGSYVLARANAKMPEINLLYGDDCLARIRETWLEQIGIKVQAAKHPRYMLANDDGHPDHRGHRDWLEQQLRLRARPELARNRLIKEGYIAA